RSNSQIAKVTSPLICGERGVKRQTGGATGDRDCYHSVVRSVRKHNRHSVIGTNAEAPKSASQGIRLGPKRTVRDGKTSWREDGLTFRSYPSVVGKNIRKTRKNAAHHGSPGR